MSPRDRHAQAGQGQLTRLRWRRAVVALLVLAVLVPLVILGIRWYDTRPRDVDDLASDYGSFIYDEVDDCVRRGGYNGTKADTRAECETAVAKGFGTTLDLREEREEGGAVAVMLLVGLLMLLAGTTFAGHDWNTGSMSNQLLFEPRRARVWAAKAAAVALLAGTSRSWSLRRTGRASGPSSPPATSRSRTTRSRRATSRWCSAPSSPLPVPCSATP